MTRGGKEVNQQIFGYVRVSTKEQNEDRQLLALSDYQIPAKNIYMDKLSGKNFDRPAYKKLTRRLKKGDLLVVKSIDRLGRNYEDIIEQWKFITKEIEADIVILDMPLLDTRRDKDLLGTFISDLVLQILSFIAQTEREYIQQRQAEGIAAAKARGVRFGRPALPVHERFEEFYLKWEKGLISSRSAAKEMNISQRTFLNWAKVFRIKK